MVWASTRSGHWEWLLQNPLGFYCTDHFVTARRPDMILTDKEHHECQIIDLPYRVTQESMIIWEDWDIPESGQGTSDSVEYRSDSDSVNSWSSGYNYWAL